MKQVCFGVIVLLAVHLVHGQVPFPGRCPEVKVQQDFQLADYMGVWYKYEMYPFVLEMGRKCMSVTYNMTSADTISILMESIVRLTNNPTNITGTGKVIDSGRLSVTVPNNRTANMTKVNYMVLGTDYTSYAVVYSCSPILRVAHAKLLWVLTREQNPPEDVIAKAEAVLRENRLNKAFLVRIRQRGCNQNDEEPEEVPDEQPEEVTTIAPVPVVEEVNEITV